MSDFKKMYYIKNVPWQRNLNYDNIPKFKNIKYGDTIVFHFDLPFSKLKVLHAPGYDKKFFISAINICLRYYQIIRNIYPYNKIGIIIHLGSGKLSPIFDALQAVVDIIPNIAVDKTDNVYFDDYKHKHIFYCGSSSCQKLKVAEYQLWQVFEGKLKIKEGEFLETKN